MYEKFKIKMKKQIIFFTILLTAFCLSAQEAAYIKAGEAKVKKSNLAFPFFINNGPASTGAATAAAADIYSTAKKNLELSTYFLMMSNEAYLEDPLKTSIKPKSEDKNGFGFEPLKTIGADFLIRTGYSVLGKELTVEMYLYHVNESKLIVGKRYKANLAQSIQIGHLLSNDVVEALTGIRPPFMSKIVAAFDNGPSTHREIMIMNWDGSGFSQVTDHNSLTLSPSWSPDGKKIAYSAFTKFVKKPGTRTALYVLDLKTNKRVLTSYQPGMNSGAIFSRDGNHIYLSMSMGSGSADIYKINLKGEIVQRLTKGPAGAINVEPSLSPDGSKIVFSSERGGRPMLYVMNSDGSNVKRLTFRGKFNSSPSWSPDGSKIAFAGQEENNFDIYIMNSDGTKITKLTSAKKPDGRPAHNEDPSFSPDGRYLVYTSNRTGKNQIYVAPITGVEERRVTNDNRNYYRPKWSSNLE